jgi:hypothetical protein
VRGCIAVVEQGSVCVSRVDKVLEAHGAVIEANVVEAADLMGWLLTPRLPCNKFCAIIVTACSHTISWSAVLC